MQEADPGAACCRPGGGGEGFLPHLSCFSCSQPVEKKNKRTPFFVVSSLMFAVLFFFSFHLFSVGFFFSPSPLPLPP